MAHHLRVCCCGVASIHVGRSPVAGIDVSGTWPTRSAPIQECPNADQSVAPPLRPATTL